MRRLSILSMFMLAHLGCATCPKQAAVTPSAPVAEAAGPAPVVAVAAPAPAPEPPPPDMTGFWAEYWAPPKGEAETQRYAFLADGRFGWLAPLRDTPKVEPVQRSGHFAIEGGDVVLMIEQQRFGDGHAEVLTTPLRTALELGECPPNREAQAVDAAYVCLSIGGRAFWRRAVAGDAASVDPEPYLH